ncbi:MAG TPA: LytTR family transcriptional regulator DNA-binding domain-containing protein [Bacteroidales bacterium]|jgi:two-component system LytT family response regulator|nr:LytTR family transcriptional regulator DNA-binding domain-containing protein [Bacteroidales bacterium]HOH14018.1 LytTR family transcriptional regulator DNA-binding domain-containing protein [Bacteroidales bacterium]
MKTIRALIIEDEAPARELIRFMLADHPEVEIVGERVDGFCGAREIKEKRPDLIFLDIQMPRLTGFELLEVIDEKPEVIFTTAFDQYAIRAFELNAVDYLLKPFSKERFDDALARALNRLETKAPEHDKIEKLVAAASEAEEFLTRIVFRKGAGIKIIPLNNVYYLAAEDDYVMIYYSEGKALKPKTMKYYEEHLPPDLFIRVHRSFIVNVEQITRLKPYSKDNYVAVLRSGEKIPVSRAGYKMLREKLSF